MELCKNEKLAEYMYYFQEDNEVFTDYYEKYINLTNQLLKAYMDIHIHKKSSFKDSKYVLRPLIYELHGDYLKTKKKISLDKVDKYLKGLPDAKVLFIINRL